MAAIRTFTRKFAYPLWPWYLAGLIFLAATNLITLEIPQLAKVIVNSLSQGSWDGSLESTAILIVALGFCQILCRSLSRILIFWPGRKLEATAKTHYFQKVMHLPQTFFDKHGIGDLISRLSNDLGQLRVLYAFAFLQLMNLLYIFVFTVFKMVSVHPKLTLICLVPIGLMLILARFVMPMMARFSRENQEAIGKLTDRVTESFTNIHTIQAYSAGDSFQERSSIENQKVYLTNMKVVTLRTLFFPLLTSLTGISQLLVLFYGGFEATQGRLSVGDILAFNIYLAYLAFPLTSVGIVLSIYQRSKTALERLSIIELAKEEGPSDPTITENKEDSFLEIRNLNFSYNKTKPVLEDLSIKLNKHQKLGIFGPVGKGKSTLFNLIARIYDPPRGTIFWKGTDILDIPPATLRKEIGYCLQQVHLFSASIKENVTFGIETEIPEDDIRAAADHAAILDDIEQFPNAWNTEIGEKGIRLSGGQKQRLALARAFLKNHDLLLLDDVLSAVDNRTESSLLHYLKSRGNAFIIASHRTAALKECDQILVFSEQGTSIGSYEEIKHLLPKGEEVGDD